MVNRQEIVPCMNVKINRDIPGLRKKREPFCRKPTNRRWWSPFISYERNGILNVGLSRNWVRLVFPLVPLFFYFYDWQPLIHGTVYIQHHNNFEWESVYYKYQTSRMPMVDNTISRLA